MANRYFETEEHTKLYQQFRMRPPAEIVDKIMNYLKEKYHGELNLAVDVGCGSGQGTFCYADHFKNVIGLDVSPNQIQVAKDQNERDNVVFRVSPAEKMEGVEDQSVQLVTAMAAVHWFDIPKFFEEVSRILSPSGSVALYVYGVPGIELKWERDPQKTNALTQVFMDMFLESPLGDFWPPQTQIYLENYRSITIPFEDFIRDEEACFHEKRGSLTHFIGQIETWSGFQNMQEKLGKEAGQNFLTDVKTKIMNVIKSDLKEDEQSDDIFIIERIPFVLLMGRKAAK